MIIKTQPDYTKYFRVLANLKTFARHARCCGLLKQGLGESIQFAALTVVILKVLDSACPHNLFVFVNEG